ncbi:hypothetical protein SCUCBS95973_008393 [Sporothrix curviconia]|uniref:Xylanolytic transcriptional activator regulatory domain-containing protein n=1 Tax=Sporothrix curviconia TaxID=1260050 RepID=A0ABP0CL76_9PEZI
MIVHAPTVQQEILIDRGGESSLSAGSSLLPRSRDALKFSICACAVASLSDRHCQQLFGESQASLLQAMQSATRYALTEFPFLRLPDLDLLRAFVFLLTSMLHNTDSPSLWVMLGTAIRLAQAQGLHRDGTALGLSPFDTEMRRRLWWYIVSLDARVTEIMGSESSLPRSTDTQLPSNINDCDLNANMTGLPEDSRGPSDMMFCLVEYETVRFLQRRDPRVDYYGVDLQPPSAVAAAEAAAAGKNGGGGAGGEATAPSQTIITTTASPAKLVTVTELENHLEDKFLRFCDPVVPLHLLTTAIARSLICKLRQMSYRGRSQSSSSLGNPPHHRRGPVGTGDGGGGSDQHGEQTNNKQILTTAARTISYYNLIHASPSLAGFLWHVHYWFPWGSPIFILKILASLRSAAEWNDDDIQAAWKQIEELHAHHPEFSAFDAEKPEYLVIGELTLKAWSAREAALSAGQQAPGGSRQGQGQGQEQPQPQSQQIPQFIADLQAKHKSVNFPYPWYHIDQQQQQQQTAADRTTMNGGMTAMVGATASAAAGESLEDMVASFAAVAAAAATAGAADGTGGGGVPRLVDSPFMGLDWSSGAVASQPLPSAAHTTDLRIGPWNLSVESYAGPDQLTTASVDANRTVIAIPELLTTLRPWSQIPGLEHLSGVGTYAATFALPGLFERPHANSTTNATAAANSSTTLSDPPYTVRDITSLLRAGGADQTKEIRIEAASTIFNAVKARAADLGVRVPRYYGADDAWTENELVGEVVVRRSRLVEVEVAM